MNIEYKYSLDDIVTTPFDDYGIVIMLGYDTGGVQYCVKTKSDTSWFKESQLKPTIKLKCQTPE